MSELNFWIEPLEPYIINTVRSSAKLPFITAIRFMHHEQTAARDMIYVGTPAEAINFLKHNPQSQEITLFVSGNDTALLSLAQKRKINLICTSLGLLDIHDCLSDGMRRNFIARARLQDHNKRRSGNDFKTLLDDIVQNRLTNESEINRRLAELSNPPGQFLSFIILDFENPRQTDHKTLLPRLEAFFPDSNITGYENGVVVLLNCPNRTFQPKPILDYESFQLLLAEYNAFAAISNATSRRFRLHTNYVLTQRILKLGKVLRTHPLQRIFCFEDFAEYFMIDLCFNSFSELLGHNDIIYLTHPDTITLIRYDRKNNTNLLDVLYYYCLNNENIVKTAQAAFMHRNTVTAKIKKIREIIHADISDGQIRQRIIFSYKILRYYEKYVGINIEERLNGAQTS